MKKLIELVKAYPIFFASALGIVFFSLIVFAGIRKLGSELDERRVNKIEAEKRQALRERDEARANDLILQGQIIAKDELIKSLTAQIVDSDAKVTNAHKETVSAKANYNKVRSNPPQFVSPDDLGRVNELGAKLRGLYPDSP